MALEDLAMTKLRLIDDAISEMVHGKFVKKQTVDELQLRSFFRFEYNKIHVHKLIFKLASGVPSADLSIVQSQR